MSGTPTFSFGGVPDSCFQNPSEIPAQLFYAFNVFQYSALKGVVSLYLTRHWHLIDYVIVRRTDRQDVKVTKTMCGADCWTDHRLVVSKLNRRIQPARRPQGKKAPKRLDVSKLNKDSMRQDFLTDICNQLDAMNLSSEDPEENWTVFHKTVLSSAASTLGHPSRKHQDWFDENDDEIQRLLEEKHRLLKAHQDDTSSVSKKAAYSNICKTVQTKLRDLQDS